MSLVELSSSEVASFESEVVVVYNKRNVSIIQVKTLRSRMEGVYTGPLSRRKCMQKNFCL